MGASVLMSEFFGQGDMKKLKREVSTTFIAGFICSRAKLKSSGTWCNLSSNDGIFLFVSRLDEWNTRIF